MYKPLYEECYKCRYKKGHRCTLKIEFTFDHTILERFSVQPMCSGIKPVTVEISLWELYNLLNERTE